MPTRHLEYAFALLPSTVGALTLLLAGCGSSNGESLSVRPSAGLADGPAKATISGLDPEARATVVIHSTDAHGVAWRATDQVQANENGTVEFRVPFRSLQPVGTATTYVWNGDQPLTFSLSARSRSTDVASTTFTRRYAVAPLSTTHTTLRNEGFVGQLTLPQDGSSHAGILVFGGSEGGLDPFVRELATRLANDGYASLAVGYWKLPGLPSCLSRIPLEYFARAIRWLDRQQGVDPRHVWTLGISRGSEAALLLGVQFPALVYGVVASVPSGIVHRGYPCGGAAWTLRGEDVPYTSLGGTRPTDAPAAVIRVERIRGPVFLYCAMSDELWPSCPYSHEIVARLRKNGRTYDLDAGHAAGHLSGSLAPNPISSPPDHSPNELAREQVWPRLLAFLEENS